MVSEISRRGVRKLFFGVISVCFAMMLASCGGSPSSSSGANVAQAGGASPAVTAKEYYRLGQGDQIRIIVFDEPELSGDFRVDDAGVISLPLIGGVNAQDLTLRQLEEQIAEKLKAGYIRDPKVNAEVANFRPFYIHGEVSAGGEYPYVSGMHVLKAVAMAGGFTARANKGKVYITRASNQETISVPANESTMILPGDVIRVPERWF